jgi:hypothetical protein
MVSTDIVVIRLILDAHNRAVSVAEALPAKRLPAFRVRATARTRAGPDGRVKSVAT